MSRLLAVLGAVLIGVLAPGAPGVASACACGGIVSPDVDARVADEMALISSDGTTETIVMRLNLQSDADDAALVIPTPTPAEVSASGSGLFAELAQLTAPRVETRRHWTFAPGFSSSAPEGAVGAGVPMVVDQVQLGPLEATTLTGGDLRGVQDWLDGHGYRLRPEIAAGLKPYLTEGWSVVALRLTSDRPLDGPLDPVRLTFTSERLVYPMRMSVQATAPQRVVIYTLGQHRMQRTDPDAGTAGQHVEIGYAGTLSGRATDQTLVELASGGDYLTQISTSVTDPSAIAADFAFGPAATDEPYQRVVFRDEDIDVGVPVMFGVALMFVLGLIITAVVLVIWLVRRTRRT